MILKWDYEAEARRNKKIERNQKEVSNNMIEDIGFF